MQNHMIFLLGSLFSCFITSFIVCQYMNDTYKKAYNIKIIYIFLHIAVSASMAFINMRDNPVLNLISWIMIFGLAAAFLYYDYEKNIIRRIFEVTVLFLILAVCESVGYVVLEFIIWKFHINSLDYMVLQCLRVTFSELWVLVLYYLFIVRVWKSGKKIEITRTQYIVYIIIIVYSVLNLSLILISVSNRSRFDSGEMLLLLINMFGIVFADLFFLYFTKFTEENGQLKLSLKLLEQQADIQYKYYVSQEEKHKETVAILHDVNRHLGMMEEIYEAEKTDKAKTYTKEIQKILQPLLPQQYANNPILNILLNDKKKYAAIHNICFELEVGSVDLEFMEAIEVTTVFGNLLDNAIEACLKVSKKRFIGMRLDTYNDFVVVHIENSTCGNKRWNNGRPVSTKGKSHGIGLMNVENIIKKYNGSIMLEEKNDVFRCSIIFNG